MAKLTPLQELDAAIKTASRDADPNETSRAIAIQFYQSERVLVENFSKDWCLEKLTTLIGKYRLEARRASDQQLQFETQLGFEAFPKTVVRKSGDRIRRADATIGALREYRRELFKLGHPKVAALDKAIALMEKYSKKESDITWSEVCKREAQKAQTAKAH